MKEPTWKEAQRKCGLDKREVEMAKELGLNPKTLIHNIPSPKEPWKDPVPLWIRRMYDKK